MGRQTARQGLRNNQTSERFVPLKPRSLCVQLTRTEAAVEPPGQRGESGLGRRWSQLKPGRSSARSALPKPGELNQRSDHGKLARRWRSKKSWRASTDPRVPHQSYPLSISGGQTKPSKRSSPAGPTCGSEWYELGRLSQDHRTRRKRLIYLGYVLYRHWSIQIPPENIVAASERSMQCLGSCLGAPLRIVRVICLDIEGASQNAYNGYQAVLPPGGKRPYDISAEVPSERRHH